MLQACYYLICNLLICVYFVLTLCRYVLDGYPMTLKQIQLMTKYSIIPVRVIEMELSSKDVLSRGVKDRLLPR